MTTQTTSGSGTARVALRYKDLWRVERAFRSVKSVWETQPIYHKCDETIRGHVFCSFLALVVMHEIDRRLRAKDLKLEWEDVKQDLEALAEVEIEQGNERYWLRTEMVGTAGKVLQAVRVGMPQRLRPAAD